MHEDDFNRVTLVKNIAFLLKQFYENCSSETPRCMKLSHFSELQNDALMHRGGSKGNSLSANRVYSRFQRFYLTFKQKM